MCDSAFCLSIGLKLGATQKEWGVCTASFGRVLTHTHTHTHKHTNTHRHPHTHMQPARTCMHTHNTHTQTRARLLAHTHTRPHTYSHTHTHIHTQVGPPAVWLHGCVCGLPCGGAAQAAPYTRKPEPGVPHHYVHFVR